MNTKLLYEILHETTVQLRKGPVIVEETVEDIDVVHFYFMPDESEAPDHLIKVDLHFITIGVDLEKAENRRKEITEIIQSYPDQNSLSNGPSYITVGGELGDQGAAFQLFALGEALGFWKVITPKKLGLDGDFANEMAGAGYILIDGYEPEKILA